MKKVLCIILAVITALSVSVQVFAVNPAEKDEYYPIIVVAGYGSSAQYVQNEDGTQSHVWGIDMNLILKRVLARVADLAIGLGKLTKGDAKYVADVVGEEFTVMFEGLRCNPDGSSVHDVRKYCNTAADSNYTYLNENEDGQYLFEPEIMAMYGTYIGDNWTDYIFNFNTDFRQSVTDCAADLDKYIDDVLEYTGAEKVNLYCVSHGGQVASTYLNIYGKDDADKLNNVLLTIPAIGGAGIAYDFFNGEFSFDEESLLKFIENGMMWETDIHWLFAEENLGFLDDLLYYILPYFNEVMGYWGSMWDFVPAREYEAMKEKHLDPVESAELIKKSDYFHYEVYPKMWTNLQECIDAGINVYIIAGCGTNDIAGYNINSDAIIPTDSSTGAVCAEFGKRFNDGYQPACTKCSDKTHNHVSPDMEIDASAAYLPEQTWYIKGLYHGMTLKSDYGEALITELMFNDELVDVHTYKKFPQFHADTNRCQSATAYFDSSVEGYVSSEDSKLVIENCSKKYDMLLVSVSCDGMELKFDNKFMKKIPAGETLEIGFTGDIPEVSDVLSHVTVNFIQVGSVTPFGSRTLAFTIDNGEAVPFDGEAPEISNAPQYDGVLSFILKCIPSLALDKIVILFYNAVKALIASL